VDGHGDALSQHRSRVQFESLDSQRPVLSAEMELPTMVSENRWAADVSSLDHALALVVARAAI
jgi:hypothetical protein